MKRIFVAVATALVLIASAGAATVQLDRTHVTTRIGEKFTFTSSIRNDRAQTQTDLVAHLNVLSSDPGTYVDPEDWSSHRTRYLAPFAPHELRKVTWTVTAVNSGSITIYVAVLPRHGAGSVSVSPPLRAESAKRTTLNSGGVLPLVLGIPAFLGLTALGVRSRRPRR